jgi:hypothetical protein
MNILTLDMASLTGWARLEPGRPVRSGTLDLDDPRDKRLALPYRRAKKLLRFRTWLREQLSVSLCVYEEPFVGRGRKATAWAFSLEATLVLELAEARVAMRSVPQATLKLHTTGSGRADEAAMRRAVVKRWGALEGADDNEIDARALLGWAVDTVGVSCGK